ncbi:hypothetical protein Bca4012_019063 [Brassica carinata]
MGEREMDFRGSRHKGKGKAKESIVLCDCGLSAKKAQSWTDENPFRRFYGCEWNNIRQKEETIMELKKNIAKFQSDWAENAEFEEDIINGFLKL